MEAFGLVGLGLEGAGLFGHHLLGLLHLRVVFLCEQEQRNRWQRPAGQSEWRRFETNKKKQENNGSGKQTKCN